LISLSLLFIIYANKNTETEIDWITISTDLNIIIVLYIDDQILLAKSDDYLQCSVYKLNYITAEISIQINIEKERGIE
jgi:hypothetical protein